MKQKLSLITGMLTLVFVFSISGYTQNNNQVNGPQIVFDKETHDYGIIYVNGDGTCFFTFTNTGNEPLVLINVRAGCGCTVPEWPREPVLPGESAEIKVKYTTLRRPHKINRSIIVTSNSITRNKLVLRIKGEIVPVPEEGLPHKEQNQLSSPQAQ